MESEAATRPEETARSAVCEEESEGELGESKSRSYPSVESSSEEVDSSTDCTSTSTSTSTFSSNSSCATGDNSCCGSSTETENCGTGTQEKSCQNSLERDRKREIVPVPVSPRKEAKVENNGGSNVKVSNEPKKKLSKEEKRRIRKLRKKLAASSKGGSGVPPNEKETEKRSLLDGENNLEERSDKLIGLQYENHYPEAREERRKYKNLMSYKMFGKLSCVSCVDALRECCGVTNDESTNGVKILRRKDPPVDLQTDLATLSNVSVVQRLKLILEKLESGQLDSVPADVLQKNIQYAIQIIQEGDPPPVKDRTLHCLHGTSSSSTTSPPTTTSPPDEVAAGAASVGESALNNVSHPTQSSQQDDVFQEQSADESECVPPPLQKRQSLTSCVASSAAIFSASAPATDAEISSTNFTTTTADAPAATATILSSVTTLTDSNTTTIVTTTSTATTTSATSPTPPCSISSTVTTDLSHVTADSETNTVVETDAPSVNTSGDDNDKNGNDKPDTTTPPTSASPPPPPPASSTALPVPTIVTPQSDRKGSISGGGANDTLSVPESRRRDESDNELSEVDEEVIPEEVRKWLASTFTKTVQPKPRLEPRPRFRSVANAIRVGLFVDRFYRQLSATTLEIPADIQQLLKEVNNWHFDIFRLHDKSTGHSLKYVAKELFSRYGIVSRFRLNLDKLESFLGAIEHGYTKLKNPYHNDIHAADVTQTLHCFIGSTGLANMFTDLEIFSLLFAALIHDFEHTGRTNNFHVNVGTELALLYNDRSVLENHHVSAAFRLLRDEDKSILSNLKPEEFRDFRNLVIEMVLSTDMSTHFAQIKNVKAILNGEKVSSTTTMALMSLLLHTADISHPGKPWKLHKRFADTILEEFFLQGDEEAKLGLPFSPLCDRNNVLIPESQISFIEFIVEPSLTIMVDLIDFVLPTDDSSGPKPLRSSPTKTENSESAPKNNNKNATNSENESSKNAVSNSKSESGNANVNENDTAAAEKSPGSDSTSPTSVTTPPVNNNSDSNSASATNNNNSSSNKNASTVSNVPPPVPLRLGQAKSQIKPFQNLSSNSPGGAAQGRRTESENCIKTAAASGSSNSLPDAGGKIPLNSRTPSFPLQSGANQNYGPVLRPWINHLFENKAKWRMISAENAAAAAAEASQNSNESGNS